MARSLAAYEQLKPLIHKRQKAPHLAGRATAGILAAAHHRARHPGRDPLRHSAAGALTKPPERGATSLL
jgi:molybdopterin-guanine dinucleotide biosynthesis protein